MSTKGEDPEEQKSNISKFNIILWEGADRLSEKLFRQLLWKMPFLIPCVQSSVALQPSVSYGLYQCPELSWGAAWPGYSITPLIDQTTDAVRAFVMRRRRRRDEEGGNKKGAVDADKWRPWLRESPIENGIDIRHRPEDCTDMHEETEQARLPDPTSCPQVASSRNLGITFSCNSVRKEARNEIHPAHWKSIVALLN